MAPPAASKRAVSPRSDTSRKRAKRSNPVARAAAPNPTPTRGRAAPGPAPGPAPGQAKSTRKGKQKADDEDFVPDVTENGHEDEHEDDYEDVDSDVIVLSDSNAKSPVPKAKAPIKTRAQNKATKPSAKERQANLMDATILALSTAVQAHLKLQIQAKSLEIAHVLALQDLEAAKKATVKEQFKWLDLVKEFEEGMPVDAKIDVKDIIFNATQTVCLNADRKYQEQVATTKSFEYKLKQSEERILTLQRDAKKAEDARNANAIQNRWQQYLLSKN
ncbi:hypothetical protein FRC08_002909 [Ceratobasidium sp. 394]|nr:hypothetical protein FRC08_002909 [Ceratobasidium sp. 394]KAG9098891.1 hypothetical protein FS749_002669 [Ceratobasidium sp. UAMH 11750]